MKVKNIKKYFKKRIQSGWREYLTLHPTYAMLGVNREDFMTKEDIAKALNLIPNNDTEETSVGEYCFYDPSCIHEGKMKNVDIRFAWHFDTPDLNGKDFLDKYDLEEKELYIRKNGKVYYMEITEGYKNKDWDYKDDDSPYWLFDDIEECRPGHTRYVSDGNDTEDKNVMRVLNAYVAYDEFSTNLFLGNFVFSSIFNGFKTPEGNDFLKSLAELSEYCKTTFEIVKDNGIDICFAIRYKSYVEPVLKKLKKIVRKTHYKL